MDVAEGVLALLGLLAILLSPASWVHTFASAAALLCVYVMLRRRATGSRSGFIRLLDDGRARIIAGDGVTEAVADPRGWASRWFCVVALRGIPGGRLRRFLVCRSENHPDDYRNLLKFLRMRSFAADTQRTMW